ncbi:hypothetical protein HanPI659440_Chr01g0026281 [Helianthus annuus]|nr:hypothetical protein HanPI659440_Chr01g0026281 [Helianthus annuus]
MLGAHGYVLALRHVNHDQLLDVAALNCLDDNKGDILAITSTTVTDFKGKLTTNAMSNVQF